MGMAATNTVDRVFAALGLINGVDARFEHAVDVTYGGALIALPALLACGLLRHTDEHFELPAGYYQIANIFLLLALMALCRIKSIEQMRYHDPGEWGKLLGLDRIPEVRTLRKKIKVLAEIGQPCKWSAQLCKEWMDEFPQDASFLYLDGHVRVYHGHQTKLPRHYVARQRLCLRATVDYWVNAMDGQPFFVVSKAVDPGLIQVLESDIIPRLEKEVPNQPTPQELKDKPKQHRFTVVFDREGYSPALFKRLQELHIASLTYRKKTDENWHDEEFQKHDVTLVSGEVVEMELAERGIFLSDTLWLREIRKKTKQGSQTSILSTNYQIDIGSLAAAMFARWCQENFFRYMRQHYGLDRLIDYGVEEIPGNIRVVNPAYRDLDGKVRCLAAKHARRLSKFGAMHIDGEIFPKKVKKFEFKKAELQEEIAEMKTQLDELKTERKKTQKHITIKELPEECRFSRLSTQTKHFIDTVKMIAYRAETSMVQTLREKMNRDDDARSLLRAIYQTTVDLIPNEKEKTLTVKIHHLTTHSANEILQHLLDEMNNTETTFPGSELRLVYELVTSEIPPGKVV